MPAKTAPRSGEARTIAPMIMDNIPTPMRKYFAQPLCFPDTPSTILAAPLKISPIPTKIVTINAVATGNEIARPANIRITTPSPIVVHLPFADRNIPEIIISIPTINKIIASSTIIATKVTAGNARA